LWDADHWNPRYQRAALPYVLSPRSYIFRQRDEIYKQHLPRGGGRHLLEVGAAPGDWMVYFYWELGLRPTGIDLSPVGAEIARRKLCHFGVPGRVICADFLAHDFGEERFDVIFFQGSLEHFADPIAPLRRAAALCREGGMIFAQIPCFGRRHINHRLGAWLGKQALSEHHLRDEGDLRRAFLGAGLADITIERLGTFQLIVEPDPAPRLAQRAGLFAVRAVERVAMPLLGRLDLRVQSRRFSPHLLAYAHCSG
jgi:SAM-dependent methyltransferase